jgi:hypothetical protein
MNEALNWNELHEREEGMSFGMRKRLMRRDGKNDR